MTTLHLKNASSMYGAAMGRPTHHNFGVKLRPISFTVVELAWVDGDYDTGGAYWGHTEGTCIYWVFCEEYGIELWIRAKNAAGVQAQVKADYPNASFEILPPESAPESEDAEKFWYSTGSGRIEIQMTMEQAESVSHSGACDDDVRELRKVPSIAEQLEAIDSDVLRSELREYGFEPESLADHDGNLSLILWLAGCNIRENSND